MAPRDQNSQKSSVDRQESNLSLSSSSSQRLHAKNNTPDHHCNGEYDNNIQHFQCDAFPSNTKRIIFFRWGSLRFGIHGIAGILSFVVSSWALYQSYFNHKVSVPLGLTVIVSSSVASIGSYGLLSQVPKTSAIASWIFPPHREAFQRTIAMVGYLNLRLLQQFLRWKQQVWFPCLLSLYTLYYFLPRGVSLSNGNTWVFVLPMFGGLSVDCWHQFPTLSDAVPFTYESIMQLNWDRVQEWNTTRVDETYILLTLCCSLQIAFMFTVAFRGIMSIQTCYWIAAVQVGLLCIRLFR